MYKLHLKFIFYLNLISLHNTYYHFFLNYNITKLFYITLCRLVYCFTDKRQKTSNLNFKFSISYDLLNFINRYLVLSITWLQIEGKLDSKSRYLIEDINIKS